MGTHIRVLSKSYHMNTNMTGFRWFQKTLRLCPLDESIASALEGLIERRECMVSVITALVVGSPP